MFRGVDANLKSLILNMKNVLVYFDPDVDGIVSGCLVCRYLVKNGISYEWFINTNREHGWLIPIDNMYDRDIIAVDFLMTREEVTGLVNNGCNVISFDHHVNEDNMIRVNSVGRKGIVVNNQYPFEDKEKRYLSGAGVVFESLVAMDRSFDTKENRALVGLTLLSDIRDIENPLAEGYLRELYNHEYTPYLKYLISGVIGERDYGFGRPRLDRNFVDYKFSPAVNSCLRFNREEMVVNFFMGRGSLDLEYHAKQKELVREIQGKAKVIDLSNLRVCYFFESDFVEYSDVLSNFVGLVASKYLGSGRSVICYLISEEDGKRYIKRASFRGRFNGLNYLKPISEVLHGVGHVSAFGIKEMVADAKVFTRVNKICKEVEANQKHTTKVVEVANLSFFNEMKGKKVATKNVYCLSQNRTYLRYKGKNIRRIRAGGNYIEYLVDGISVMCFDIKLSFKTGLILPVLERGIITYYLEAVDEG